MSSKKAVEIASVEKPDEFKLFGLPRNIKAEEWQPLLEHVGQHLKWANPKDAKRLFRISGAEIDADTLELVGDNEKLILTGEQPFRVQGIVLCTSGIRYYLCICSITLTHMFTTVGVAFIFLV